jgi:hypothetical protein
MRGVAVAGEPDGSPEHVLPVLEAALRRQALRDFGIAEDLTAPRIEIAHAQWPEPQSLCLNLGQSRVWLRLPTLVPVEATTIWRLSDSRNILRARPAASDPPRSRSGARLRNLRRAGGRCRVASGRGVCFLPTTSRLAKPPPPEVVASVAHGGADRPIRQPTRPPDGTLGNGGLLMPQGGAADTFP